MAQAQQARAVAFYSDQFALAQPGGTFFGLLTDKALRRGVFTSVKELEAKIQEFIDHHNDKPKPFVWTKSASKIMEKVGRARQSLSLVKTV